MALLCSTIHSEKWCKNMRRTSVKRSLCSIIVCLITAYVYVVADLYNKLSASLCFYLICVMGGLLLLFETNPCWDGSELVVTLLVLFLACLSYVSLGEWRHESRTSDLKARREKPRDKRKSKVFMSMLLLSLCNYFLIIVTAPSYSTGIRSGSRLRKSVYKPRTTSSWTVCKSFRPSSDIIPK